MFREQAVDAESLCNDGAPRRRMPHISWDAHAMHWQARCRFQLGRESCAGLF